MPILGQRCNIARANAALPQGLALLAERFHQTLLPALLGHGGSCAAGRALVQALARSCARFSIFFQSWMSTPPPGTCRRARQLSATPARALPERARREGGSPPPQRLHFSASASTAAFSTGLALQDVGGHSDFFYCGIGRNCSGHS